MMPTTIYSLLSCVFLAQNVITTSFLDMPVSGGRPTRRLPFEHTPVNEVQYINDIIGNHFYISICILQT